MSMLVAGCSRLERERLEMEMRWREVLLLAVVAGGGGIKYQVSKKIHVYRRSLFPFHRQTQQKLS
jgi:hypothetical protein